MKDAARLEVAMQKKSRGLAGLAKLPGRKSTATGRMAEQMAGSRQEIWQERESSDRSYLIKGGNLRLGSRSRTTGDLNSCTIPKVPFAFLSRPCASELLGISVARSLTSDRQTSSNPTLQPTFLKSTPSSPSSRSVVCLTRSWRHLGRSDGHSWLNHQDEVEIMIVSP